MQDAVRTERSTAASVSAFRSYPFNSRNVDAAFHAVLLFPCKKGWVLVISFISAAAFSILFGYISCPKTILFGASQQSSRIPGFKTTKSKPCLIARYLLIV